MVKERKLASEYEELIKKAQEMPGIIELMKVYGQYEEMIYKSNYYLGAIKPKIISSTTDSSL